MDDVTKMNQMQKIRDAYRHARQRIALVYFRWKYRGIDPDLCCCGGKLSEAKPWDSICAHGGCRSAKDYAIACACKRR